MTGLDFQISRCEEEIETIIEKDLACLCFGQAPSQRAADQVLYLQQRLNELQKRVEP